MNFFDGCQRLRPAAERPYAYPGDRPVVGAGLLRESGQTRRQQFGVGVVGVVDIGKQPHVDVIGFDRSSRLGRRNFVWWLHCQRGRW